MVAAKPAVSGVSLEAVAAHAASSSRKWFAKRMRLSGLRVPLMFRTRGGSGLPGTSHQIRWRLERGEGPPHCFERAWISMLIAVRAMPIAVLGLEHSVHSYETRLAYCLRLGSPWAALTRKVGALAQLLRRRVRHCSLLKRDGF